MSVASGDFFNRICLLSAKINILIYFLFSVNMS